MCFLPLSIMHYVIMQTLCLAAITAFAPGSIFIITKGCWFGNGFDGQFQLACLVLKSKSFYEGTKMCFLQLPIVTVSNSVVCCCFFKFPFQPHMLSFKYNDIFKYWGGNCQFTVCHKNLKIKNFLQSILILSNVHTHHNMDFGYIVKHNTVKNQSLVHNVIRNVE